jgi:hypothetical protein
MPVPLPASPYDSTLDDVLNLSRARLNDAIASLGGEVFTDQAVWSQTAANGGWRRLQEFMAGQNSPRLISTEIVYGLQVAQGANPLDPGLQAVLNWNGYFDGRYFFPAPSLPRSMICPIRIWERVSNQSPPARFTQMEVITQGTTPIAQQGPRNGWWEWRNDSLCLPGSTQVMDLQIRFAKYLPDFITEGSVQWYQQPVPIMRAKEALAWFIASEVSSARGDVDVAQFDTKAEAEALKLVQREKMLSPQKSQWIFQSIPIPPGSTNYDPVLVAIQRAQVRLNVVNKMAGDYLTVSQEWTQQAAIGAWRKLQEALVGLKLSSMNTEAIVTVPAAGTADPGIFVSLSWGGYNNGSTLNVGVSLPQNLVRPLRLWERQSGSNALWTPMECNLTGIGSQVKQSRNYEWQWRGNAIWMPGATVPMDIRIEYSQAFPDFEQEGSLPWYLVQIPISRAADALAWFLCAEVAASVQGNPDIDPQNTLTPELFGGRGAAAAQLLVSRDAQAAEERGEWPIPDLPPQSGATTYDYASTIMNAAQVRLNQASKVAGDVISRGKPFTNQFFNNAYRKMQDFLRSKDFSTLRDEAVISPLPPTSTVDTGALSSISWSGYNDGVNQYNSPSLPTNLIRPIRLWERQTTYSGPPLPVGPGAGGDLYNNSTTLTINYVPLAPGNTLIVPIYLGGSFSAPTVVSVVANNGVALVQDSWVAVTTLRSMGYYRYSNVPKGITSITITVSELCLGSAGIMEIGGNAVPDVMDLVGAQNNTSAWNTAPFTTINGQDLIVGYVYSQYGFIGPIASLPYTTYGQFEDVAHDQSATFAYQTVSTGAGPVQPQGTQGTGWAALGASYKLSPPPAFSPMELSITGLGEQPKQTRNYSWQWRADKIWLPGSTVQMDLRIEYDKFLPDIVASGTQPWYLAQVPIARCLNSLAWYICSEVALARPDLQIDADDMISKGEVAATEILAADMKAAAGRGEWPIPDIPSSSGATPYDPASLILNIARSRLNRVSTVAGDVISVGKPFTQTYYNAAFRRLCEFLSNLGWLGFTKSVIIPAIPPTPVTDPAILCYLSWSGYFDGAVLHPTPALPQDLIIPLECWERWSFQNARFGLMQNSVDGAWMESQCKITQYLQWAWRTDAIYFPGSQQTEDMKIRYAAAPIDLVLNANTPWYLQPVPIVRCEDALSLFICAEVARARPDLGLDYLELTAEAEQKARLIYNRDTRAIQRVNMTRQPRSGRSGSRMGWGSSN